MNKRNSSIIAKIGILACMIALFKYKILPLITKWIVPKDAITLIILMLIILFLVVYAIKHETKTIKKHASNEQERFNLSTDDSKFEEWFKKFHKIHLTEITLNSINQCGA